MWYNIQFIIILLLFYNVIFENSVFLFCFVIFPNNFSFTFTFLYQQERRVLLRLRRLWRSCPKIPQCIALLTAAYDTIPFSVATRISQ